MCFEGEANEFDNICDWTRELTNQPGGAGFSRGDNFFFFVSLVLADKADGGSFSGTTEVAEIPQFWCKLFEIKQKCQ